MTKKMLIDAAHPEEVRVAVLSQNKIEDFDFESENKKPLRGNIFLARVTRVEPSLQAAFVDYGGNRHGFLAFSEIHPDYYQIPVSDRKLLQEAEQEVADLAAQLELAQRGDDEDEDDNEDQNGRSAKSLDQDIDDDDNDQDDEPDEALETRNGSDGESASDEDDGEDAKNTADLDEEEEEEEDGEEDEAPAPSEKKTETSGDESDDAPNNDASDNNVEASADTEEEKAPAKKRRPRRKRKSKAVKEAEAKEAAEKEADKEESAAATAEADDDGQSDEERADTEDDQPKAEKSANDDSPDDSDSKEEPEDEAQESRNALLERYKDAKRKRANLLRNYKIQEVIKRRQILLIQVVKEERGNKGAALTTYMSLAGRYCVLMPNTARGGGISRKIANGGDRRRLRRVVDSLHVPQGMGLIIRTAGSKRTKTEIKRDYDYLLRMWENIRSLTLKSIAPCLIYEEASLIKRAIRDLYDKDISKVYVEGEEGYREAKDFMKMLMPSHAKNVQPYKDKAPIFHKHGVETQLDGMYHPSVRMKSGGYLVIHQTEALVAIDVNSGRSTRERNIEQTALKTNIEAAEEAARQFRLRDLAGLIVIDFIDMEEPRNNRKVEKALKDALKNDRARLQVGRISSFGLLEMSRQRRRSGIVDGTTQSCPTCSGAGVIRSHETAAVRILRAIEGDAITGKAGLLSVRASTQVTLHILNHNRDWISRIEENNGVKIEMIADPDKAGDEFDLEKSGTPRERIAADDVIRADDTAPPSDDTEEDSQTKADSDDSEREDKPKKRRRRRRGRKGSSDQEYGQNGDSDEQPSMDADSDDNTQSVSNAEEDDEDSGDRPKKRRRRGRRGGRRNRRDDATKEASEDSVDAAESAEEAASKTEPSQDDNAQESKTDESQPTDNGTATEETAPTPDVAAIEPVSVNGSSEPPANGEQAAEEVSATESEAEAVDPAPKEKKPARRGWWNRSA